MSKIDWLIAEHLKEKADPSFFLGGGVQLAANSRQAVETLLILYTAHTVMVILTSQDREGIVPSLKQT